MPSSPIRLLTRLLGIGRLDQGCLGVDASDAPGQATARANLGAAAQEDLTELDAAIDAALVTKAPLESPAFTGVPVVPTAAPGTDTTQAASTAYVRTEVAGIVDSSPGTLDTLNELAAALEDDPNFAASVAASLGGKHPLEDQRLRTTDAPTFAGVSLLDGGPDPSLISLTNPDSTVAPTWRVSIGAFGNFNGYWKLIRDGSPRFYEIGVDVNGNFEAIVSITAPTYNTAVNGLGPWPVLAWTDYGPNFSGQLTVGVDYPSGVQDLNLVIGITGSAWRVVNGAGAELVRLGSDGEFTLAAGAYNVVKAPVVALEATGDRGGNSALASVIAILVARGLMIDGTT